MQDLTKQFRNYVLVGFVATAAHYGVLVGLVESGVLASVPATLAGYLIGGVVSYRLNRRHAFPAIVRIKKRFGDLDSWLVSALL